MHIPKSLVTLATLTAATLGASTVFAADWTSDTVGYKYYAAQSEPGTAEKVGKNVFNFTHVSGDKLGSNLFSIDYLKSDNADPAKGGSAGASEWYGFYKRTYSINKSFSAAARIDLGTKNTSFASAPAKLHLGVEYNVPVAAGFWSVGINAYKEANNNGIVGKSVSFDLVPELTSAWAIPLSKTITFDGFLNVVGAKGKDGFGAETAMETLLQGHVMFDVGSGVKVGAGLQYWNNKFGCDNDKTGVANSCKALSPMFLATYKF